MTCIIYYYHLFIGPSHVLSLVTNMRQFTRNIKLKNIKNQSICLGKIQLLGTYLSLFIFNTAHFTVHFEGPQNLIKVKEIGVEIH